MPKMEQKTPRDHIMDEARAGLMAGKRGLVMGVANDHSIAWGIAQSLAAHGAQIAFTYQGDAQKKRLGPLAASIGSQLVMPADVESDEQLDAVFATLKEQWGTLDFLVHSLAFSDRDELKGRYVDTSRANFARSLRHASRAELERLKSEGVTAGRLTQMRIARRWLHRDDDRIPHAAKEHVAGALASSPYLAKLVAMREELRLLWTRTNVSAEQLVADLQAWLKKAEESGIAALQDFALRLRAAHA